MLSVRDRRTEDLAGEEKARRSRGVTPTASRGTNGNAFAEAYLGQAFAMIEDGVVERA